MNEKSPVFLMKEINNKLPSFSLNTDKLALIELYILNSPDYPEFRNPKYSHVYIGRTYLHDIEKRFFNIYYKLGHDQSYCSYMFEVIRI